MTMGKNKQQIAAETRNSKPETDLAKATNSKEMLARAKANQPAQELPQAPAPKAEPAPAPAQKPKMIGLKVQYRDYKKEEGPLDRTGFVVSWGREWVTILNLEAKKVEYAVPGACEFVKDAPNKVA